MPDSAPSRHAPIPGAGEGPAASRPGERTNQKRRTREAILAGARALMERGEPVSVVAAAAESGVSKATAYRYFSDGQALMLEAGLAVRVLSYEVVVAGAATLAERLAAVTLYFFGLAQENEMQFRRFLARTLDLIADGDAGAPRLRAARRVAYLRQALAAESPRLPAGREDRLVNALTAIAGIEAVIALQDIGGLAPGAARDTVRDLVAAILDRHLAPGG